MKGLKLTIFRAIHFLYFCLAAVVTFTVGLYFTILMFINYKTDTTILSNSAFVVLALLASLSFSCARLFEEEKDIKTAFTFAGERCFHGAVMLLLASVLKYAMLSIQLANIQYVFLSSIIEFVIGGIASVLFLWAMVSAHSGVHLINDLLGRSFRHNPESEETD